MTRYAPDTPCKLTPTGKKEKIMNNQEQIQALIEAGEKATREGWRMIFNNSKARSVRSTRGIIFNAWKPMKYTGQDERYDEELTETKSNCEFIVLAANSRPAISAMLEENVRLRKALDSLAGYADLCVGFLSETHTGKSQTLRRHVSTAKQALEGSDDE